MRSVYFSMERFPSGQREQTVNLSVYAFEGSNPSLSTTMEKKSAGAPPVGCRVDVDVRNMRGNSSVGRASAFQAEGRGFESRFPLQKSGYREARPRSSVAERFLGKEEVKGPIPFVGSTFSALETSARA